MALGDPIQNAAYPTGGLGLVLNERGKIPLVAMPPYAALPAQATVSALNTVYAGSPPDGAVGSLRLGTSPLDLHLALSYDSTLGKWVSDEKVIASAYIFQTPNTALTAYGGVSYDAILPYRLYSNAGLSIQARQTVGLSNTTGGVHVSTTDLLTQTIDTGGAFNAGVQFGGAMAMTQTGATTKFVDSGWVTLAPGALTDWVLIEPVVKSDAGGNAQVLIGTTWVRMVG